MSLVRISTSGPQQTSLLHQLLLQRGLQALILSPTEIGIDCADLPDDLGSALANLPVNPENLREEKTISSDSSGEMNSLENSTAAYEAAPSEDEALPQEWDPDYVPQREFILAPYWRQAKTASLRLIGDVGSWTKSLEKWIERCAERLHAAEERILNAGDSSEKVRQAFEASLWIKSPESAGAAAPVKRSWDEKNFALAGAIMAAALIAFGLAVIHHGSSSSRTVSARPASVQPSAVSATSTPVAPSSSRSLKQRSQMQKPSPVKSAQLTGEQHKPQIAGAKIKHDRNYEEDDQEVVTHYYKQQNALASARKTNANGVKYYSDIQ